MAIAPSVRAEPVEASPRVARSCVAALLGLVLLAPSLARAQADAGAPEAVDASAELPADADAGAPLPIVPPVAKDLPPIEYPPGAQAITAPVPVGVLLEIDANGDVVGSELTDSSGQQALDDAVLAGVRRFKFVPAHQGDAAIAVKVPFTHTFVPPPKPIEPEKPSLDAVLEGVLVARGSRDPVAKATVVGLTPGEEDQTTETDANGLFRLPLRSGPMWEIRVVAEGYKKFVQKERLYKNEQLKVKYLLEKESYGQYESVVRADRVRTEVSRTQLSGREITQIPGTFGDPYRVMLVLPGVTTVMGLLPLPIVRGSSPGNTGIFIDNIRLPLLFHLFGGPSVVHPEMVDHIDFYPGGFPVTYGGYTGGIVDGITRAARKDEKKLDVDLNLVQTGVFVRHPIPKTDVTATLAGRVGYPGVLLSLLIPTVSLGYWDYQARFDGGGPNDQWSVFFFGAEDVLKTRETEADPLQTLLRFTFHRLDLKSRRGDDDNHTLYRITLGFDDSNLGGDAGLGTKSWTVGPQIRWHRTLLPELTLNLGVESNLRTVETPPPAQNTNVSTGATDNGGADQTVNGSGILVTSGAFGEVQLQPAEWLMVIPGVRFDRYDHRRNFGKPSMQSNADPRLLARFRVYDADVGGTWLKGVVGRYHQPPRLFIPLPGVDQSSLDLGLLASTQVGLGAETKIAQGVDADVNVYYSYTDPTVFDLAVNPSAADVQQPQPPNLPWEMPPPAQQNDGDLNSFFVKRPGRAYGLEVLLRKRDSERLFGWISYTLSRSQRQTADQWELFDFDRTHILNFVAGLRLPRNWELGGRVLLQTGTPLTTIFGRNIERTDGQFRLDIRIDKRAVWNSFLLDFYVDIVNTTVAQESGGLLGSQSIRYLIPTIGFRGVL